MDILLNRKWFLTDESRLACHCAQAVFTLIINRGRVGGYCPAVQYGTMHASFFLYCEQLNAFQYSVQTPVGGRKTIRTIGLFGTGPVQLSLILCSPHLLKKFIPKDESVGAPGSPFKTQNKQEKSENQNLTDLHGLPRIAALLGRLTDRTFEGHSPLCLAVKRLLLFLLVQDHYSFAVFCPAFFYSTSPPPSHTPTPIQSIVSSNVMDTLVDVTSHSFLFSYRVEHLRKGSFSFPSRLIPEKKILLCPWSFNRVNKISGLAYRVGGVAAEGEPRVVWLNLLADVTPRKPKVALPQTDMEGDNREVRLWGRGEGGGGAGGERVVLGTSDKKVTFDPATSRSGTAVDCVCVFGSESFVLDLSTRQIRSTRKDFPSHGFRLQYLGEGMEGNVKKFTK
ncbi:hypothetical protein RRG08_054184 [Elysia crispata]|uniref:Uncharacterized protein n=1 Tax=Elysia crispata TaxID=231223 RepID=A0AAE1A3F2_9GAST|nr:hypothetical protein RRG08_054184 [Elysia crispata]